MKTILLTISAIMFVANISFAQIAKWPLDQDTKDAVGSNHGIPSENGVAFVTDDIRGKVLELDGVTGFITLPEGIFTGAEDATVTCWFKWSGGANWQRVYGFGHINDPWAMFYMSPQDGITPNMLHVTILGQTQGEWFDYRPDSIETNQWYFTAAVFKADTFRFYLNNKMIIEEDTINVNPSDFQPVGASENYIGKSHWPDATFNGRIDDLRIYNTALSTAEILDLYGPVTAISHRKPESNLNIYGYDGKICFSGFDENQVSSISVYNIAGIKVFSTDKIAQLKNLDLRTGLYVVNLNIGQQHISKKVVLTK